ncbi:MAG: ribonucleoside triphosphate reductase [Fibrobacteria bacterium]|nr:ribonucleoside triphosphate reductase [Fibrobacteria bacterium]
MHTPTLDATTPTPSPSLARLLRKRDGRLVPFEPRRIETALAKAGAATGEFDERIARRLAAKVLARLPDDLDATPPSVEEVQDLAEEVLLASPYRATAKAYILYRDQHARLREWRSRADIDLVDGYLRRTDWQVRENANMGYSLQGLNNYIASSVSQNYWLEAVYSPRIRSAHQEGDLHLHDLNQLSVYCVGWDLQDLLLQGFRGVPGKAQSKPARHFRTALGQIVNFFYTLQGEAAGAQAFSSFDTFLAPFIRADRLDFTQVKQALQEFVFNINVPTRVGFQAPFTNVTLDLICPRHLADQAVILGGEFGDTTYGEHQPEMDLFNRAFFEVMSEGDAVGRIMTFPIPTINLTKEFDWDSPSLEGLWEMTSRYGIPYFSNFIHSDLDPADSRSMCCRLRIDNSRLEHRGGGLFGAHPLTGSIGVVTLNLPRAAHRAFQEAGGGAPGFAAFRGILRELLEISRDSLERKRKALEQLTDSGLFPYTGHYLRSMKERFGSHWRNHFSTIGIVGMNEACENLGLGSISEDRAREFALETLDFLRSELERFQEETGNLYNLEATPAEGTSHRLALKDKARFPDIVVANEAQVRNGAAAPFYTNSSHLPVDADIDLFDALDHQDDLQTRYTGGTVLHLFLGEYLPDPMSVKALVRGIAQSYRLPYFSLTPTFSICPGDGYLSGEHFHCPICSQRTEVYSRVVGYLRPVDQWNEGKQAEFDIRSTFDLPSSAPARSSR